VNGQPTGDRTENAPAKVYGAILFQTLVSAFTYLAATRAMRELSPASLLVARVELSALVFGLILLATPGRKLPPREAWLPIAAFGFLVGPLNQGLFLVGLDRSSSVHAGS
jgi:drug/metabolite transporter (DMT)-like permease